MILYWMRANTLRTHENPALDVAVHVALEVGAPLLVALHIEDQYPNATARRQLFLLQGAAEVLTELEEAGFSACALIDRDGARGWSSLKQLADMCQLVVTDEPFCTPLIAGLDHFRTIMSPHTPMWAVDTASVVPSALVPVGACHRAYTFEQATRDLQAERLGMEWPAATKGQLPLQVGSEVCKAFSSVAVDLRTAARLDSIVQEMDVDHSVRPVSHTVGGSSKGYRRWESWVSSGGLKTYAQRRNDALDHQGVSRLSAYLNAGMVSPMRIARETANARGAGKSKFLHEFLTWRGVSYAFCYHFPMPAAGPTLAQLPSWSQDTLRRHAHERRSDMPIDKMAAAATGNAAWDGMQLYLRETGELHNNARMGWGKAIAKWAATPEQAIEALVVLNNRYALDGHAPPSYGGLLGCLGLFEGQKREDSILGKVAFKPPKPKYSALALQVQRLTSTGLSVQRHPVVDIQPSDYKDSQASAGAAQVSVPDVQARQQEEAGSEKENSCVQSSQQRPAKRRWAARSSEAMLDVGE